MIAGTRLGLNKVKKSAEVIVPAWSEPGKSMSVSPVGKE